MHHTNFRSKLKNFTVKILLELSKILGKKTHRIEISDSIL